MSVILNLPATPSRIAAACEYLQTFGDAGTTRDEFDTHMSPLQGADEEAAPGTTMARSVLTELERLRLAVPTDGGNIRIAPWVQGPRNFEEWSDALTRQLRELFMDTQRAQDTTQSDVTDALAWLMCQNAAKPISFSNQHADLLNNQFDLRAGLTFNIANNQRFQNLCYWARYFGFAEITSDPSAKLDAAAEAKRHTVPDPSRAISDELPYVFDGALELPIQVFVDRLAQRLPILETGSFRTDIESRLKEEYRRDQAHFSSSTTLGLRRLELAGVVDIVRKADAVMWICQLGTDTYSVSHLRYLGGAA